MPILGPADPLPARPRRVLVSGTSGAGKTTVAARLAPLLGVPHVELDALRHGPHWAPRAAFADDVRAFSARPGWITEWQYDEIKWDLADRADLVVWLDLPRTAVLRQVVRRTVVRRLRRAQLWNGNTEPPLRTVFTDPEHVIRWAWARHGLARAETLRLHDRRPQLPIVRLRRRADVTRWLRGPAAAA